MKNTSQPCCSIEVLEARIAPAAAAVVDLAELNGSNGFTVLGQGSGLADSASFTVSNAGDVNGDGLDDLLLGELRAPFRSPFYGTAFVIFGTPEGFGAQFNPRTVEGTDGFKLYINDPSPGGANYLGASLSAAGDINGDGYDDVIVASPGSQDVTYVVFGKAAGFAAAIDCAKLDGTDGFAIVDDLSTGPAFSGGLHVSGAGDLNADGFEDVITGSHAGAYVVFGKVGGFGANVNRSALDGNNGFELLNSGAILSLSAADDVNGDTIDDVIVGGADKTSVVFGKDASFVGGVDVAALDGTDGFSLVGAAPDDAFGKSVSSAGDVNADGLADIIVGAPNADASAPDSGAGYVFFARADGFPAVFAARELNGTNGFRLSGVSAADQAGTSVSGAGDINGDGIGDVLIGAPGVDATRFNSGSAYVVFGKAGGFEADLSLATLDWTRGFALLGRGGDNAGSSVSAAGDVNGDGIDDLMLDYSRVDALGAFAGAFVVYGALPGSPPAIRIADAYVSEGDNATTQAVFTVHLSKTSPDSVSVQYATAEGTARADRDYHSVGLSTLLFAPGELSKTITVDVIGDTTFEPYETFSVKLSAPANATLHDSEALGTIINDDPMPEITVFDAVAFEGSAVTFTVRLSSASSVPVTVQYSTADDTASSPGDYSALPLTELTFAPGEVRKEIAVTLQEDTLDEPEETFSLNLSEPSGATLAFGSGTGTIFDASGRVLVQLSPSGRKATFTDVDGDLVKVKTDRGVFTQADFLVAARGQGGQIQLLDLAGDAAFNRATISLVASVPAGGTGDGAIRLGYLNATAVDLKDVLIDGDLGEIDAGVSNGIGTALKSLTVGSLGRPGLDTQGAGVRGNFQSNLDGDLRSLTMRGDMDFAFLAVLGRIGSVAVGGDLESTIISARGELLPGTAAEATAIASISVEGRVSSSIILAGYAAADPVNADASIGKVLVNGSWSASSLVAGLLDVSSDGFGRNDTLIPGGDAEIIARIAKVKINGAALGSTGPAGHFGITAEAIGKAKIGGSALALTPGPDNILLDATNTNVRLVDFA